MQKLSVVVLLAAAVLAGCAHKHDPYSQQSQNPVVKIDGRVIGNGRPGTVTGDLIQRYHALTKVTGEPIYE